MRRTGDTEARGADAFYRGRTHEAEGDLGAAQHRYREAAEAGHRAAAVVLGGLLASESVASVDELVDVWLGNPRRLEPAEQWWRRGIRGLDAGSARQLGGLLDWDPEVVETEHRLRVAYEAGDAMAGYRLASLLEERGSLQERGFFGKDRGWLSEAGDLFDTVREQTRHTAEAIDRRYGSWWYPGWRLRQVVSSGRTPWGIDSHAFRTHGYALARCKRRLSTEWPMPEGYLRRRLEREHDRGDIEATFLRGVLEPASKSDDAEP